MVKERGDLQDLLIIGGGINGCGIARDAAGRGLKVTLAEMNDLAWATSSSSTKLFHGGLRYLEYFEFRLVREALIEREVLLKAMPHISWPMRFVLPYHRDMRFESDTPTSRLLSGIMPWMKGRRPAWLIRFGLFLYDYMGGRQILPGTKTLDLTSHPAGRPLKSKFKKAFEYSDCWIEDSRLVVLNAQDAAERGADIRTRCKVTSALRHEDHWTVTVEEAGETREISAKMLVNAGGPWVEDVIKDKVRLNAREGIRLVRGSHIVTHKLFDHDKCYFFQGTDGRIIFAIPYENEFTLIGTTDAEHNAPDDAPECSPQERDYLIKFASQYFEKPLDPSDIVWSYSGVRPLYDDGASSATAATREYVLTVNKEGGAPMLNIFGGKITTYRKLAEAALEEIRQFFPEMPQAWTSGVPMPGGDLAVAEVDTKIAAICKLYPFLNESWAKRLFKAYGTQTPAMLGNASSIGELGQDFGATLTACEVDWLMDREWARTAEDIVWRRSKLGLRLTPEQISKIDAYMLERQDTA